MYKREPTLLLQTVTPAFIGASQGLSAEWNGKGIRGELRWWFRAVAGGESQGNAVHVRTLEREVFGGAASAKGDGEEQSSALRVLVSPVRVDGVNGKPPLSKLDESALAKLWGDPAGHSTKRLRLSGKTNPIGYVGYGPIAYESGGLVYKRPYIAPGQALSLVLQWSTNVSPDAKELLDRALWCWINLGGIGARSRRGFGSLVRTDANEALADVASFKKRTRDVLGSACKAHPTGGPAEWTHFTDQAHIHCSGGHKTWEDALNVAGAWMIAFRRRYGKGNDERTSVRNRDYEWFKAVKAGGVPDRAGFGLPLPFSKEQIASWGDREGRRASPLLIHIAKLTGNDHRIILTHIPARLVPDGREISFKGAHSVPTKQQQGIVHDFLGDLAGKKLTEVLL